MSNTKNFVGTQERVRISHGKRAIGVRAIEVRLYVMLKTHIFLFGLRLNTVLTTTNSSPPTRQDLTTLASAWPLDGVLCLLHFTGRAPMVALFNHKGQVSVGDGWRLLTASENV